MTLAAPHRDRQGASLWAMCPDENTLTEFVDGVLSQELQRDVEVHIDTCGSCRQMVAELADDGSSSSTSDGEASSRYRILGLLGAGATSTVYEGLDVQLARKVAIKLFTPAPGVPVTSLPGLGRFRKEARIMARLSHPNILPVYDAGILRGEAFIAMERVNGQTLTRWLQKSDRTWREIVDVFIQAGRGLAAAHARGVVHRDFKPSNVLVGEDDRVRVADFGLATLCSRPSPEHTESARTEIALEISTTTLDAAVVGTPAYMAPEQFSGVPATERSDQFAFCVSLHEALYGSRPFSGQTLNELSESIRSGRFHEPRVRRPRWRWSNP